MSKQKNIPVFDLSEKARAGLHIKSLSLGLLEKSEHAIDIAHRDDSYLLFILKGGSGRVLIDFEEFQFTGPAFCLIRPEQVHSLVEYNTPEGWLLSFDPSVLAPELLQSAHLIALAPISELEADALTTIYELAHVLYTFFGSEGNRPLTLQHGLNALVSAICDLYQSAKNVSGPAENRGDEITVAFRQLVERNFMIWKRPAQYAEALYLSVNHLTDTVRQKTGFPASYWIQYQTMLEAKRLLYYTQRPVKDLAYELGFPDPHYFSRLFRKVTGHTPIEFRQLFHDLSTKTRL